MRRMVKSLLTLLVLAGAALALVPPAAADEAVVEEAVVEATVAGPVVEVAVRDDRFTDSRLTIAAGTTVSWVHKGHNTHTVSSFGGDWESGVLSRGESFSYTFTGPGTYQYLCRQHLLQGMRGTVTVE